MDSVKNSSVIVRVDSRLETKKFISIQGRKLQAFVVNPETNNKPTATPSKPLFSRVVRTFDLKPQQKISSNECSKYNIDKNAYQSVNSVNSESSPQMAYKRNKIVDFHSNSYKTRVVEMSQEEKERLNRARIVNQMKSIPIPEKHCAIIRPSENGKIVRQSMETTTNYSTVGTLTDDINKINSCTQTEVSTEVKSYKDAESQTEKEQPEEHFECQTDSTVIENKDSKTDDLVDLNSIEIDQLLSGINWNMNPVNETTSDSRMKLQEDLRSALEPDQFGNLPIHSSVLANDFKLVKRHCLIVKANKYSINLKNRDDNTPLQLAILRNCDIKVIEVLLNHGANLNDIDENGCNILHLAVKCSNHQILEKLLKHAKAVNFNLNLYDFEGLTPLLTCATHGYLESAILLLKYGADVDAKDKKSGRTALFYAAENHDEKMVKLLLSHNANTKMKNFFGTSPHDAMYELTEMPTEIKNMILKRSELKKKLEIEEAQETKPKKRVSKRRKIT